MVAFALLGLIGARWVFPHAAQQQQCAQSRPDHHRHAARRSRRRVRLRPRADAGARRARAHRRPLRPCLRLGADHASLARHFVDGPLSARARRARQRHGHVLRADAGDRVESERLQNSRIRRGFPARPSVRTEPGLRRLQRPPGQGRQRQARQRAGGLASRRRSDCVAEFDERRTTNRQRHPASRFFSVGPPVRAARAVRRRVRRPARARSVRPGDRRRRSRSRSAPERVGHSRGHAGDRHERSRRSLRRTRRIRAQHFRVRHNAARAAHRERSRRTGSRRCRTRDTGGCRANRRAAARRVDAGRERHRHLGCLQRWHASRARAVRRIVRAAARVRLGAPARASIRVVEVHRRAQAGAVRHRAGCARSRPMSRPPTSRSRSR